MIKVIIQNITDQKTQIDNLPGVLHTFTFPSPPPYPRTWHDILSWLEDNPIMMKHAMTLIIALSIPPDLPPKPP